ncbi:universal stress protein [Natrarchaeobius chitinivorans]|uniref:Universal stress protein UspA n=1 Tax=Natrarchaeobius chitinivorans TaxID=1679083 RepID=A0A3N6M845_NATCH|nr:universal stress protein [Natrarchaeobius chitinivorans]RQG92360.1 universal stress protein UspA [Natrarchaeobius chitinivorans]
MAGDRLLVPVANPETADRLLDTAVDLAADRDLEIVVLTVVTVPMQLSLVQARQSLDVEDEEELVSDAVERVRGYDVDASGRVRFGRSVASGICGVAADVDAEAVLLGWRGRPRRRDVVLGSYIDAVLADAPCDVLVERIDRDRTSVSSVLVPVAGGPHTALASSVAGSLARAYDARVELLTVVPDRTEEAVSSARDMLTRTSPTLGAVESVEETVLEGPVVDTIVDRSELHDVTVVGAAEGGLYRRVLVGDVPETVAREADGSVVMVKRNDPVSTALWRRVRDRVGSVFR